MMIQCDITIFSCCCSYMKFIEDSQYSSITHNGALTFPDSFSIAFYHMNDKTNSATFGDVSLIRWAGRNNRYVNRHVYKNYLCAMV